MAENDFDAGINTSTAWTEHLDGASLSDEEQLCETGRQARALYAFEGKPEFRELTVEAGDDLDVIKERIPDGWSLVRRTVDGQIGLLPRSYYTFTSDFVSIPADTTTPRPSQPIQPQNTGEWLQSLLGGKSLNRFSSFVTSGAEAWVLNGSPNEPTTPTEENPTRSSSLPQAEADKHYVDTGPSWKSKIPPFKILVHSPSKRSSVLSGAYTVYSITSLFSPSDPYDPPPSSHHNRLHSDFLPRSRLSTYPEGQEDDEDAEPEPLQRLTVYRRFSHFVILHTALTRRLPGIALPPLPEKQYTGRFNDDFIEARRGDLERYINKIVRHPIARYAEIVTFFLSCENDNEWHKLLPQHTSLPPSPFPFYAKVYHPAFNVDFEDASLASSTFSTHVKAVSRSVQGLRSIFSNVREARLNMARAERGLGYALLGMITRPRSNGGDIREEDEDEGEEGEERSRKDRCEGVVNKDGAWCWREDCQECIKLTKGLQKFSETLQSIADLYDDHARRTQLATHESLKSMAHPDMIYEPIISTHDATLPRYKDALASTDDQAKAELASRCETVLNTTMAEMDIYHTQKVEDFERLAKEHLDGEIRLYEQILTRLRSARQTFTTSCTSPSSNSTDTPITPSLYALNLFPPNHPNSPSSSHLASNASYIPTKSISTSHKFIPSGPSSNTPPGIGEILIPQLPQPTPHVYDSAPMRPVNVAVKSGVGVVVGVVEGAVGGLRFGSNVSGSMRDIGRIPEGEERGSVFGRFWS